MLNLQKSLPVLAGQEERRGPCIGPFFYALGHRWHHLLYSHFFGQRMIDVCLTLMGQRHTPILPRSPEGLTYRQCLWVMSIISYETNSSAHKRHAPQKCHLFIAETSKVNWAATFNNSQVICHLATFCQPHYLKHSHFLKNSPVNSQTAPNTEVEHSSPAIFKRNDSLMTLTRFPHQSESTFC